MKELINQHDAEGKRHGGWEYSYLNGTFRCRCYYYHGKLHGVWERYYEDGTLGWRGHYHHGILKSLETGFNPNFELLYKIFYLPIK